MHKMPFWKNLQKVQILNKSEKLKDQVEKEKGSNPLAFSNLLGGLSNISQTVAASKTVETLQTPEPSEYIRKIGNHFISFIQQLDSFFDEEMKAVEENQETKHILKDPDVQQNFAEYFITTLGKYIEATLSQKYL